MRVLWKLLRKNISAPQIIGFSIANLLGLIVMLLGAQFFFDTQSIFSGGDSFIKNEFIIISKKVSLLGSVMGDSGTFDEHEITELESKPFVESVGEFSSCDFRVYASISFAGQSISSDIFFESVPDRYIDVKHAEWHFSEGDNTIPIIVPRNYLNLYNFGFSQSRNLPRLTESAIEMVNFDVRILEGRETATFKGNIVGFSNRLNTILVPESFTQWANSNFGRQSEGATTRLIVEVENSSDRDLLAYFKEMDYDIEGGALEGGEMVYFSRIITLIMLSIGLIVTLLSIYILILSLYLLLEKNSSKIKTLIFFGYSPWQIITPYTLVIAAINATIIALAITISLLVRDLYLNLLTDVYSMDKLSADIIYYIAVAIYAITMVINTLVIRAKIMKLLPSNRQ